MNDFKYIGTGDIIYYRGKYYTVDHVDITDFRDSSEKDEVIITAYSNNEEVKDE